MSAKVRVRAGRHSDVDPLYGVASCPACELEMWFFYLAGAHEWATEHWSTCAALQRDRLVADLDAAVLDEANSGNGYTSGVISRILSSHVWAVSS